MENIEATLETIKLTLGILALTQTVRLILAFWTWLHIAEIKTLLNDLATMLGEVLEERKS